MTPQLVQKDTRIDDKIIVQARALMSRKAILHNVANKHWVAAQATDLVIRLVQEWMARPRENKISLSEHLNGKVADANCLAFVCHQKDLRMSHGLLYMEMHAPGTDENIFAFVVPAKKQQAAIDGCHHNAGHQGRDRTLSLMKERFWWPGMVVQVVGAVKGCLRCKQFEAPPAITDLVTIESTEPLDLVHIDIVNMETTVATKDMTGGEESSGGSGSLHEVCQGVCYTR